MHEELMMEVRVLRRENVEDCAMKDVIGTTAVIAAIALGIVVAIMAPKGFQLGPPDPIANRVDVETSSSQ
jgi:uncharacterized membrane protein (DUF441 family)